MRLNATEFGAQNLLLAIVRFGKPACQCRTKDSQSATGNGEAWFPLTFARGTGCSSRLQGDTISAFRVLSLKSVKGDQNMQLGCSLPVADIGTGPAVLRDYTQAAEGLGYAHLVAPDHVLGTNPNADHGGRRVGTTASAYHDPFVLLGFLSGCTQRIGFAVGVLILA